MAEVADYVIIDRNKVEAAQGKWQSPAFATGARNVLITNGKERHNAFLTLRFSVPKDAPAGDAQIRVIVNGHPLPSLLFGREDSMNTAVIAFPASFLNDGGGNLIGLHAKSENSFIVFDAIVHFRQNS